MSELTFQTWKLSGSTTVGCTISFPGKTPQVTAMAEEEQLVMSSVPYMKGAWSGVGNNTCDTPCVH